MNWIKITDENQPPKDGYGVFLNDNYYGPVRGCWCDERQKWYMSHGQEFENIKDRAIEEYLGCSEAGAIEIDPTHFMLIEPPEEK